MLNTWLAIDEVRQHCDEKSVLDLRLEEPTLARRIKHSLSKQVDILNVL